MKILFDQFGNPLSPETIKNDVDRFSVSYTATVHDIIKRSQNGLAQDIFFKNVAQLMANFKMTRSGLFKGVKYLRGTVQDPNGQIAACWSIVGSDTVQLRNYLSQQNVSHRNRTLVEISESARNKVILDLWTMLKKLLSVCMSNGSYGLVAASKVLFAVLPEIAQPIDNTQWKSLYKTVDYGDIIALMAKEIISWEKQTGQVLDSCDPHEKFTLPAIYNVMAMRARP
ncbi:MAG TPA: hypothetical protein VMW95_07155 [Desulfobacterales bacterium]|nr:hypothetical protein [Desulfobacterales bacterium]